MPNGPGVLPKILPVTIHMPGDLDCDDFEAIEMEVDFEILVSTMRSEVRRRLVAIGRRYRDMYQTDPGGTETYGAHEQMIHNEAWHLHQALRGLQMVQILEEEVAAARARQMGVH